MTFQFFEKLSRNEAEAFLQRFLAVESAQIGEVLKQCSSEGINANFGIGSISVFMRWIAAKLKTIPRTPDMLLPDWIRESDAYSRNLFDLDFVSKVLILRAAYYFGESFVKGHPSLRWTIGNTETAEANMPVITGFQSNLEMAPILISENLLRRVTADPNKIDDVDKAIDFWIKRVPV